MTQIETNGWRSPGNILAALALVFSTAIGVSQLWLASRVSKVEASLTKSGQVASNNHFYRAEGADPAKGKTKVDRWDVTLGQTYYFGVKRRVWFDATPVFPSTPTVMVSLNLQQNDWSAISSALGAQVSPHVVAWAPGQEISKANFVIQLGLGVPQSLRDRVIASLTQTPTAEVFDKWKENHGQDGGVMPDRVEDLTAEQRWAINFEHIFGVLEASWVAHSNTDG